MQFRTFAKKIIRSELDFSRLEKTYRIDSLALHKLNLSKVLEFYRQIDVKHTFESKKGKTWFQNQLRIFIWTVFNYGNYLNKMPSQLIKEDWQTISQYFHKDYLTCKYFFLCIEKSKKSGWTQQEDHVIIEHINKPGFTNQWTEIGKELYLNSNGNKFKKPKEIRQRWNNYLNPNVLKDKWAVDQDLALFRIVGKEGRKWALISKILKTRSEHSVKNRYTNLFKKFKSFQSNAVRLRRSQLQAQFIKISLKRLEEQKGKFPTQNQQPTLQIPNSVFLHNQIAPEPKQPLSLQKPPQYNGNTKSRTFTILEPSNQNPSFHNHDSSGGCFISNIHTENPVNNQQFIYEENPQEEDISEYRKPLENSNKASQKFYNLLKENHHHRELGDIVGQKVSHTVQDSKSHTKEKELCGQSSFQVSPELEFIKSPVNYNEKDEDFMSTENLMRSFQPSYHHYLFD